jgi:hypothetical protein
MAWAGTTAGVAQRGRASAGNTMEATSSRWSGRYLTALRIRIWRSGTFSVEASIPIEQTHFTAMKTRVHEQLQPLSRRILWVQ